MENKQEYTELETEVIRFEAEDVITSSTDVTETPVLPSSSINLF